jgi:hypothetical protein
MLSRRPSLIVPSMTKRAASLILGAALTLATMAFLTPGAGASSGGSGSTPARRAVSRPVSPATVHHVATAIQEAATPPTTAPSEPLPPYKIDECEMLKAERLKSEAGTQTASSGQPRGPKPKCGNGTCEAGENSETCPGDCPVDPGTCGNGTCDAGETSGTCPSDCPNSGSPPGRCGDGICAWPFENITNCSFDCPCQTPGGGPIC